jgi:uncharacterized phiE125 gp8 family phage protein
MYPRRISGPVVEPVSLAEAKAAMGVTSNTYDVQITSSLKSSRQWIETWLGRVTTPQVWEIALDAFPLTGFRLWPVPVISIDSVKYDDADGIEQTVDAEDFYLDARSEPAWALPIGTWGAPTIIDAANAVRIRFTSGYADAASVPEPIKQAIILLSKQSYNLSTRDLHLSSETVPGVGARNYVLSEVAGKLFQGSADALLQPYRVYL